MRILVLVAGTNEPSNSNVLADAFIEGLKQMNDIEVDKLRLKDLSIDHFTMKHYEPSSKDEPDFARVRSSVTGADGVVISAPIWNFSVPAHLKNLIDRIGAFALDAEYRSYGMLKSKPFFLIYTGGTPYAAWGTLQRKTTSHLPTSIRYFGGAVLGIHYEERATLGKGKFGLIVNSRPRSLKEMRRRGRAFAMAVERFAKTGKLPAWEMMKLRFWRLAQKVKVKLGI